MFFTNLVYLVYMCQFSIAFQGTILGLQLTIILIIILSINQIKYNYFILLTKNTLFHILLDVLQTNWMLWKDTVLNLLDHLS